MATRQKGPPKTPTRVYVVTKDGVERLVESTHPAFAVRHVVREEVKVRLATTVEVLRKVQAGAAVEKSDENPQQALLP